jgi:hypothetical protein
MPVSLAWSYSKVKTVDTGHVDITEYRGTTVLLKYQFTLGRQSSSTGRTTFPTGDSGKEANVFGLSGTLVAQHEMLVAFLEKNLVFSGRIDRVPNLEPKTDFEVRLVSLGRNRSCTQT